LEYLGFFYPSYVSSWGLFDNSIYQHPILLAYLRKYELLRSITMQEWTVEVRKRLHGKAKGQLYKVFKRKKDQKPFYTMLLGAG